MIPSVNYIPSLTWVVNIATTGGASNGEKSGFSSWRIVPLGINNFRFITGNRFTK